MSGSDVARIKQQIEAEYIAAKQGLSGLAYGTSQHQFISQKMENMERCREQLASLVGQQAAMQILTEALAQL